MNYKRIYDDFIADRREKEPEVFRRKRYKSRHQYNRRAKEFYEHHHIVPQCYGGSDDAVNIISLTPEDHFFAHKLLAKIYGNEMWRSLYFMSQDKLTSAQGVQVSRYWYGLARRKFMENLPPHIEDMGNRLVNNAKRRAAHRAYVEQGKIAETVRARYQDESYKARWVKACKDAWNDERRKKTSEKFKRSWGDPDYIEKMKMRSAPNAWSSDDLRAMWKDPIYVEKMRKRKKSSTTFKPGHASRSKKVRCVETGQVFESAKSAGLAHGHTNGNQIAEVCRGLQKTAAGFRWVYVDTP